MDIILFTAPLSSGTPIAQTLLELDPPHRVVELDLANGDQRDPEYLALNPNGQVPTLVVDGTPMFESLAIFSWLAERFGEARGLWPGPDTPSRLTAMSWTTWSQVTLRRKLEDVLRGDEAGRSDTASQVAETQALVRLVEDRLKTRPHLLGEDFSLADLMVGCTVTYGHYCGLDLAPHPHLRGWLERMYARPSFAATWGDAPRLAS